MTTAAPTRAPERDWTKHRYELVPIVDNQHRYPHIVVGDYVRTATGEHRAIMLAGALMADHDQVERMHVYHSHPSPGPMRRYAGRILRDEAFIRRPL
jgi:hypothetical protein